MTDQRRSKWTLPGGNDGGDASLDRRRFLTITGTAAVGVAGYVPGAAAASDDSTSELGYGAQPYGEFGFGGAQTTN